MSRTLLGIALVVYAAQTARPNLRNPLAIDEQVTYYLARGHAPESVLERATMQSATPPLYFWLAEGSLSLGEFLTGDRFREWWLRFPAWLALLSAIPAIYALAEKRIGAGAGGAAALLLACHAEMIPYATQARPYSLGLLETIVAGGCLLRLRSPGWSVRHLIGFLAASVALLWTHYLFAILLPVQLLMAMLPRSHKRPACGPQSATATCEIPKEDDGRTSRAACRHEFPLSVWAIAGLLVAATVTTLPLAVGIFRLLDQGRTLDWVTTVPPWYRSLQLLGSPLAVGATLGGALAVWIFQRKCSLTTGQTASEAAPPLILGGAGGGSSEVRRRSSDQSASTPRGQTLNQTPPTPPRIRGGVPAASARMALVLALWFVLPVAAMWLAGRFVAASLAQLRYVVVLSGPAVLLGVFIWRTLGGARLVGAFAVLFVLLDGAPHRILEAIKRPETNEGEWRQAALLLNERARPGDLVLVYSGLVETRLVPVSFRDPGFQEYTTSRLSGFYLHVDVSRSALPIPWQPGEWSEEYRRQVEETRRRGGQVWLVIAADTDFGQRCEKWSRLWLEEQHLRIEVVRNQPVARVLLAHNAAKTP